MWSLPGGNVESDVEEDTIKKTLQREFKEEVGVEVEDKMELVYTNSYVKTSDGSKVLNLTFLTRWKNGEAKPLEDTARIKWYTLDELKSLDNPPDFLKNEISALLKHLEN